MSRKRRFESDDLSNDDDGAADMDIGSHGRARKRQRVDSPAHTGRKRKAQHDVDVVDDDEQLPSGDEVALRLPTPRGRANKRRRVADSVSPGLSRSGDHVVEDRGSDPVLADESGAWNVYCAPNALLRQLHDERALRLALRGKVDELSHRALSLQLDD